jgi:hypothetical protein
VSVTMSVAGAGTFTELTAALSELDGVVAVSGTDTI